MQQPRWLIDLDRWTSAVLRTGLDPSVNRPRPPERHPTEREWRSIRAASTRHRLDGLLVHAVAHDTIATTDEQRAEIAELEIRLVRQQLWHDGRLLETTEALTDEGVEFRVLKGPAFGALDYTDRLMRPTGDIDLLVHGRDLTRAVAVLVRTGGTIVDPEPVPGFAEEVGKSTTVRLADGLEVDVHRMLARGPFGVRMSEDLLWNRSRSFDVAGWPLPTLGLEESLLHAALHLMVLSDRRALSVRDVAQFLVDPALDASVAIELASQWRVDAVLGAAVLLAAATVPDAPTVAQHPLVEWAAHHRPRSIDRAYLRIARPDDPIGPAEWPATLVALPTMRQRRLLVRSILRPDPDTIPSFGDRARRQIRRGRNSLVRRIEALTGRHRRSRTMPVRSTPAERTDRP